MMKFQIFSSEKKRKKEISPENKSFYDKYSFSKLAGPRSARYSRNDNIIKYYIIISA